MIIPSNRLILWTGIVFASFAALVPIIEPAFVIIISVFTGIFILFVIIDALLSSGRLNNVNVELPEIIRLSKGKDENIPVRILNKGNKLKEIRIGLAFPPEIITSDNDMIVELPEDTELSTFLWSCRPTGRGSSTLEQCYLTAPSPAGFWTFRRKISIHPELRVYPDLFSERKEIAFLFQNRGIGAHSQRLIGKGRDFEQLREYMPGDSFEDIHWKATAKRLFPVTKVYQIERTQEVYFIIDASRMSNRRIINRKENKNIRGEDPTILERYISAALIMGLVTEKIGDLFGFAAFSSNIERFMKAGRGKPHFNACRESLYSLQPTKASPDFSELASYISMKIRHRSLLIFMTTLDDPILADNFIEQTRILSKKHLVMVDMLNPGTVKPLFSSPVENSTRQIYENLGSHMLYQNIQGIRKRLERQGTGFLLMNDEKLIAQLTSQYLDIKQKQQL